MSRNKIKLYALLTTLCLIGYVWIYLTRINEESSFEVCLIKSITHIPCPSCGSTRSVISLTKGDFVQALSINPIGYIIAVIMLAIPVWILFDIIFKRNSLLSFFQKLESFIKKPKVAILLVLLILINWTWNIIKGI